MYLPHIETWYYTHIPGMPLAFHLMICQRTDPEPGEPDDRIFPPRKGPKAERKKKNKKTFVAANQGFRVFEPVKNWEKMVFQSIPRCCPPTDIGELLSAV